jgi:thiol-disulfide isomerase/thioredoxin
MKEYFKRNGWYIAIAFAAISVYLFYYVRYRVPASLKLDELLVEHVPGENTTLGDVRNGTEVIHFYAHWCGPCLRELKVITNNYDELKKEGLDFVFLTDDNWTQIEQMKMLLPPDIKIYKIKSLNEIGVRTIPATFIVNDQNNVVFEKVDACHWEDTLFLREIRQLLKK